MMSLVWERAPYTAGSLLVFLALADWSNDDGVSWPSIQKIASKTRLERRSVQYIIRQLKRDEMVYIEEGRGRGHQHRFTINAQKLRLLPCLISDGENVQPTAPISEIKGVIHDAEKVQSGAQKVKSTAQKVQPVAPDPLVEPSADPSVDPPYTGQEFLSALAAYDATAKQRKVKESDHQRRVLFKKLARMGEVTATEALENTVANGWQGVFEPHRNGHAQYTKSDRNVANIRESLSYLDSLESERKVLNGN